MQEVKTAEEELFDRLVKETRDILERYVLYQFCFCEELLFHFHLGFVFLCTITGVVYSLRYSALPVF